MPIFRTFRSKTAAQNVGNSFRWPSNVLIIPALIIYNIYIYTHVRQYKHVLDEWDHGNKQNFPFPKLHIELLEHFEGSRTFTNFIEPLLPKYWTEQTCISPYQPRLYSPVVIGQHAAAQPCPYLVGACIASSLIRAAPDTYGVIPGARKPAKHRRSQLFWRHAWSEHKTWARARKPAKHSSKASQ